MPRPADAPDARRHLDVRLVSAGPNGIVDIDPTVSTATLLSPNPSLAGDDVWVSFELR